MEQMRYPFDTEDLSKGSTVPAQAISNAYGCAPGTKQYQLALLRGREYITTSLAARGEFVTVIVDGDTLRILTDDEQVDYNSEQFRAGVRKAGRAHARMLGADRSKITSEQLLAKHDRSLEVQGRQLAAVRREAHRVAPPPSPRLTPGKNGNI